MLLSPSLKTHRLNKNAQIISSSSRGLPSASDVAFSVCECAFLDLSLLSHISQPNVALRSVFLRITTSCMPLLSTASVVLAGPGT